MSMLPRLFTAAPKVPIRPRWVLPRVFWAPFASQRDPARKRAYEAEKLRKYLEEQAAKPPESQSCSLPQSIAQPPRKPAEQKAPKTPDPSVAHSEYISIPDDMQTINKLNEELSEEKIMAHLLGVNEEGIEELFQTTQPSAEQTEAIEQAARALENAKTEEELEEASLRAKEVLRAVRKEIHSLSEENISTSDTKARVGKSSEGHHEANAKNPKMDQEHLIIPGEREYLIYENLIPIYVY